MIKISLLAGVGVWLLAAPAVAQTYNFVVTDASRMQSGRAFDNNQYRFALTVPTAGVADYSASDFTLRGVTRYEVTFPGNPPTSYTLAEDDFTFYVDPTNELGGLDTPFDSYLGPQLFTGTTQNPVFRIGSFDLSGGSSIAISLAAAAGAVPEPTSWAMMILGMGAVGYTLRRKVRVSELKFDARIKRLAAGEAVA